MSRQTNLLPIYYKVILYIYDVDLIVKKSEWYVYYCFYVEISYTKTHHVLLLFINWQGKPVILFYFIFYGILFLQIYNTDDFFTNFKIE